jgi:flavin reductase (DIM6/NTAB) family NADH-FMN oxidoreductase RutF
MAVGWSTPVSHNPWMMSISVHPSRYTHKIIDETREFTVNIPTTELTNEMQYCGEYSGEDVDKFKELNLTPVKGKKVKCPSIKECIAYLECKVTQQFITGDHTTFIGKIIYAEAEEDLIKINTDTRTIPDRYFDPVKCEILLHLGGDAYITTSEKLYVPEIKPPSKSWKDKQFK